MRTFPKKCLAIGSIVFFASGFAALRYANAQATSSIPFVGCASDGQLGPRKAPHGNTKVLTLSPELASKLAYYQAQEGSGVLAPRGWRCFSTYGSNGGSLFVAPQLIDGKLMFSDKWKGFSGPVVQISDSFGGTSGRFEVASIIARVFPAHKAFVANVIAEGMQTAADFPSGPYPKDKLHYRSREAVEYETPPQTEGLGTRSRLQKSDKAVTGVEMLSGPNEELNLVSLAIRLPQGAESLARAIVQQTEREIAADPPN
jgi:hypothetical protein